jgi:hypothetical protein
VQTLDRSITTQLTVMFLLPLVLFGGESIRHFVVILLIGILSGTVFFHLQRSAHPVVWENQEWRQWFRKGTGCSYQRTKAHGRHTDRAGLSQDPTSWAGLSQSGSGHSYKYCFFLQLTDRAGPAVAHAGLKTANQL